MTCAGGATLCAIVQPLEGSYKDQKSYMCLLTSTLSMFGYTEPVKETQTCQKVSADGVDSILCVCTGDNCNSDDTAITTFNSGTFLLTIVDD